MARRKSTRPRGPERFYMTDDTIFTAEDDDAGMRLDLFLAARIDTFSRSRIQKLIDQGAVLVNGEVQPARHTVRAGSRIEVTVPPPLPATPEAQAMDLDVLFEDEHLLVINKPAGLVVHPGAGQPDHTLVNALLARPGAVSSIGGVERPGIVHRLDKDTSGLLAVAKNDAAHTYLTEALARRDVKRVYWALALRAFLQNSGSIDEEIGRHEGNRLRMAVCREGRGKTALTHWRVAERFGGISLVECRLATGRTHQIRVHLTHAGHPVLGDTLYGGGESFALQLVSPHDSALRNAVRSVTRQMLHARELGFTHPATGEPMHFTCEPPKDFMSVLTALRTSVVHLNSHG